VVARNNVGSNRRQAGLVDEPDVAPATPPGLALAGTSAGAPLISLFDDFFVARKPLKGSPHTEAAYRGDLAAISAWLAADLGTEPGELRLGQVTAKSLRRAFAAYSDSHAAASIARAWAAWNQFFSFLVADEVVVGNPMAAVAKPKVPARAPKALQGEGTPERLLEAIAAGERHARHPWPEHDLTFVATALLTGLRLSELLGLDLGSVDGREGERRLKVTGKGSKVRFVPIEAPLEAVINHYLSTRKAHCPKRKLSPSLHSSWTNAVSACNAEGPSTWSASPTAGPASVPGSPWGHLYMRYVTQLLPAWPRTAPVPARSSTSWATRASTPHRPTSTPRRTSSERPSGRTARTVPLAGSQRTCKPALADLGRG
jgi:site-specific recombinase XerC